jgi:hypothetical protein
MSELLEANHIAESNNQVKVGDVFVCSWGYEQTNVDFYQVTRTMNKAIEIREIKKEKRETGNMSGVCTPIINAYVGEPMRKTPKHRGGANVTIKLNSYSYADLLVPLAEVDGVKIYPPRRYSEYA